MTRLRNIPFWVENGRLKSMDGDVLGIVQQVKEISSRLDVWYDDWDDGFTITETSLDGAEIRLVFRVPVLDQRVIDRLLRADQWRGREDPEYVLPADQDFASRVDAHNEKLDAEQKKQDSDQRLHILEEFAYSMEFDGRGEKAQIWVKESYKRG